MKRTIQTLALMFTLACSVEEDPGAPPVAGTCGQIWCYDESSESTCTDEEAPERTPVTPEDELELVSERNPVGAAYAPESVAPSHLKCCYSNSTSCVATGGSGYPGTCTYPRILTACYGCDFLNPDDWCSTDFNHVGTWTNTGGIPTTYMCNGFAWNFSTGVMLTDRCSLDGCAPADGGVCWTDEGDYSPNGCPDFTDAATAFFDGALGRMCCRTDASSPTGYACHPREMNDSCNVSPHTAAHYCMPCTDPPGWYDPDGSGSNNTNGAWDLIGTTPEPAHSVYCGTGDQFYDTAFGDTCQKVEYVCRGVEVNASTGQVVNNECS